MASKGRATVRTGERSFARAHLSQISETERAVVAGGDVGHPEKMSRSGPWAWLMGGIVLGCATTPVVVEGRAGRPPDQATSYYPFVSGFRWAYQVERGGETILATTSVIARTDDSAIVQAGVERISYAVLPDGIARRDGLRTGDYLLRTPIRAGASWPIEGGEAKVAAVGKAFTTPGASFPSCATIEESRTNPQRITRTVYCEGTGPVSVEVQVHDPLRGVFNTEMRATLLGLTRPGEDPLGAREGAAGPPR